jgi:hypothetical protein
MVSRGRFQLQLATFLWLFAVLETFIYYQTNFMIPLVPEHRGK